jgi:ketosteroid isomerase-like protein
MNAAGKPPSFARRSVAAAAASILALLCSVPASAQAAGQTPLPSIELPAELDRVLRDYERGWQAGDEAALAGIFSEDGFVPTRTGWVRGRAAILRNYENSDGALRLRAHAFATGDSVGYIVGAYGYGAGASVPDTGKFLLALRRAPDGRWLIAADLDSGNPPPQPGAGGGTR